jgi:cell division septum initiation protein DivIVA
MDQPSATAVAATIDGLAATIGTLDSKLTARLERLDERLDDQYDRVRSVDGKLDAQSASMKEMAAKAVDAATADIIGRIASLEDTVLTLAEALLRPAIRVPQSSHAARRTIPNGSG